MRNVCGFTYRIAFLSDECFVDSYFFDAVVEGVEGEDDREDLEPIARDLAYVYAEKNLKDYGADDYEVNLVNAY
jgi:hypothetical protein